MGTCTAATISSRRCPLLCTHALVLVVHTGNRSKTPRRKLTGQAKHPLWAPQRTTKAAQLHAEKCFLKSNTTLKSRTAASSDKWPGKPQPYLRKISTCTEYLLAIPRSPRAATSARPAVLRFALRGCRAGHSACLPRSGSDQGLCLRGHVSRRGSGRLAGACEHVGATLRTALRKVRK